MDEAVLHRLLEHAGFAAGPIYGKKGKQYLHAKVDAYNQAARRLPWVILVDLNHEVDCVPLLRASWLPDPAPMMCFRVAIREIEAWLLADRERFSAFFSVARSRIPQNAEATDNPKQTVIDLAKHSRRREIREEMVPRSGSGRDVGPAYNSRLIEFVTDTTTGWRPDVAVNHSESLRRCVQCLSRFSTTE